MVKKTKQKSQKPKFFLYCVNFLKNNWHWIVLTLIVAFGAFLRFYLLGTRMHFDIDEATHTETVYGIWTNQHFIAKGPPTSNGIGLYHGAFYYYLLLPVAVLWKGNPLALGAFCALLSTMAVYFLGRAMEVNYGKIFGLTSALLLAVSYETVLYGRWIWNPNIVPFFMALSLFALAKVNQKKANYLILFAFSVSAITQLHVGGFIFVPIFLILIPFLFKLLKNKKIWFFSIVAFLVPWLPTIYYEFAHNFEMVRGIIDMLAKKSDITLWQHLSSGLNYLGFMFDSTFKLPPISKYIFIYSGLVALVLQFKYWRDLEKITIPLYILLSLLFSLLIFSFYPGTLYIHLSEHLFVIYPILTVFILQNLFLHRETVIVSLLILYFIVQENVLAFNIEIINGDRQYETEKRICQTVKSSGQNFVEIVVNGKVNPIYITYICQNRYGINTGSNSKFTFDTDLKDSFGYSIEKYLPAQSDLK